MDLPIFPFSDLTTMAWNNTKKQKWDTKIQKSGGGRRKTLSRWSYPEWTIDCAFTCLDPEQIEIAAGFLAKVRGAFQPFRWKDPEDYREENVQIGIGDGITTGFQLIRNLAEMFVMPIYDIVPGTLDLLVNGKPATYSEDEGWVEFTIAPALNAPITATFEYYWRVAFEDDELDWEYFWYNYYKLNKFTVVTVR